MRYLVGNCLKVLVNQQLVKAATIAPLRICEASVFTLATQLAQKHNAARSSGVGGAEHGNGTKQQPKDNSIKITLLQNQQMTVTALEEAKHLAKRRNLHLVKTQDMDAKTQRPVYKLLTSAERLQEELSDLKSSETPADKTAQKKSEKTLNIGSRISEHDLASRLKNITKWLNKRHEVRILIQGNESDMASCEKIFKTVEDCVKTPQVIGKIVQKRTKGTIIKFNILPTITNSDTVPNQ